MVAVREHVALPSAPPWCTDLVLACFGLLFASGWIDLALGPTSNWPVGLACLALYVAEHWAFAHRMRGGLARIAAGVPGDEVATFEAALPAASYGLLVGAILRAAARYMVLVAALRAFGWLVPAGPQPTYVVVGVYMVPLTAELVFAFVWAAVTMRFPPSARAVRRGAPVRTSGQWTRRQIERWHRGGPWLDLAANAILLVWSCLLFGVACQAFAADMATWSDRSDPMHPALLGFFLVFATGVLTIPLQVSLHLDSWLERAAYATTPMRRWHLRGGAWAAMACGLGPAWMAYWRYCCGA